jgi:hypothetical protein
MKQNDKGQDLKNNNLKKNKKKTKYIAIKIINIRFNIKTK